MAQEHAYGPHGPHGAETSADPQLFKSQKSSQSSRAKAHHGHLQQLASTSLKNKSPNRPVDQPCDYARSPSRLVCFQGRHASL